MAGVNLSRLTVTDQQPHGKGHFAVSGFWISIVVLLVTLAGWGGLRWYIHSLDQKVAALDTIIADDTSRLTGDDVDRVADFSARLTFIGSDPATLVDPQTIFAKLESLVVPQVTLVKYEHDQSARTSTVSGTTDNFRYLAEQIVSFKGESSFVGVQVGDISRSDKGAIEFTLIISF